MTEASRSAFVARFDYLQRPDPSPSQNILDGAPGVACSSQFFSCRWALKVLPPQQPHVPFRDFPLRPFSSKDRPTNFQPTFADSQSKEIAAASGENPPAVRACQSRHADAALSFASIRSLETDRPT